MALATEWYPEIGVKNSWDLDGAQEELESLGGHHGVSQEEDEVGAHVLAADDGAEVYKWNREAHHRAQDVPGAVHDVVLRREAAQHDQRLSQIKKILS